jgi:hypothetical protein
MTLADNVRTSGTTVRTGGAGVRDRGASTAVAAAAFHDPAAARAALIGPLSASACGI